MFRPLKPHQIVVDVVVALLFVLVVVSIEQIGGTAGRGESLAGLLVALIFGAALAMRRLSPGLALGLAWVGALAQMGLGRQPGPVDLAIFAVLYATAAYGSRVVFWLGFTSAFIGAGVITLYLVTSTAFASGQPWEMVTTAAAVLVPALFALMLAWTVGALVRTATRARDNRAAQRRAEEETVAEQERVRIARDMHDVVAHSLAVVIAQADGARYASASDPAAATAALTTISATARSALADVRLLLTQLRHSQGEGPQPMLADLEELYAHVRAAGVDLLVDVDPAPRAEPPATVQLAVYRILQEALTNALRHGSGTVAVRLAWLPDRLELSVRNAMKTDAAPSAGHGVIGMRERAQLAGGSLTVEAIEGAFLVRATIPMGGVA